MKKKRKIKRKKTKLLNIVPKKEWRIFMPLDELIEREAKKFARDAAKFVKSAAKLGREMLEIFMDEIGKDIKDELKGKKKIEEETKEKENNK